MSLSKKNLAKLNIFIKKNNPNNNNNSRKNPKKTNTSSKVNDPSNIFYSIINNTENIADTAEPNQLLKNSEESFHNKNSNETNYSINLSNEDQLYDEFNYLLDE